MNINLNKELVTKQELLKKIKDVDIYRFYIGEEIILKDRIKSPLRDDNNPSFGFFVGQDGEICFNDFVLGGGDCIRFVELMFGLSYFEALSKITTDFNLEDSFHIKQMVKTDNNYDSSKYNSRGKLISKVNNFSLGKKRRDWTASDYAYWLQYGIPEETLLKYNVEPNRYIFVNNNPLLSDKFSYTFIERKDNSETYKIYQPFNENYKWLNNHNDSIWQGWEQLPDKGEVLIITKSLKDVMTIDALTGIPTVALQSESVKPKEHIIEELKSRFKIIYLLYDNDFDKEVNWGRKLGGELADSFNLIQVEIEDKYKSKDISDLVKNHGKQKGIEILEQIISVPF